MARSFTAQQDKTIGLFLLSLLLKGMLQDRSRQSALDFLRTLASTVARRVHVLPASLEGVSLYSESLRLIDPAYAKYFAKHYSQAYKTLRRRKL